MRKSAVLPAAAVLAWAGGWLALRACAPEFAVVVFTYSRHPDFPRDDFLGSGSCSRATPAPIS